MPRFLAVLVVILLIFSGLTYLLHRIFRNRYIKYVPALISLVLGTYQFYLVKTVSSQGFEDIARIMLGAMLMAGFLSGMASGVLIDFVRPRMKDRQ